MKRHSSNLRGRSRAADVTKPDAQAAVERPPGVPKRSLVKQAASRKWTEAYVTVKNPRTNETRRIKIHVVDKAFAPFGKPGQLRGKKSAIEVRGKMQKWGAESKPSAAEIERKGTALSKEKMAGISRRHPTGTFVAFHLATGHYVTSGSQAELVAKFEAKFGDDWGWFERVR